MKRNARVMALSLIDGLVFALLVMAMTLVRYDFHTYRVNAPGMLVCAAIALVVFLIGGPLAIYRGRYRRGSTDQFAAIVGTVALGVGLMWVVEFAFAQQLLIPTSVTTTGSPRPTLVVGAGDQGMLALDMIAQDTRSEFVAVGILDDDPAKRHLRYNGTRVLGPISDIAAQVDRTGAGVVIIAIADLQPDELSRIASHLESRPVE